MVVLKVDTYLNNFQFMSGAGSVEDCYLRGGNIKILTIVKVRLYNVNLLPRETCKQEDNSVENRRHIFSSSKYYIYFSLNYI